MMKVHDLSKLLAEQRNANRLYLEFLRVPALSCGLYVLPAGSVDPQKPHTEDEVYYIIRGRGVIVVEGKDQPVEAGSIVFVPAGDVHRFHSITEELQVLVFFAPAEGRNDQARTAN